MHLFPLSCLKHRPACLPPTCLLTGLYGCACCCLAAVGTTLWGRLYGQRRKCRHGLKRRVLPRACAHVTRCGAHVHACHSTDRPAVSLAVSVRVRVHPCHIALGLKHTHCQQAEHCAMGRHPAALRVCALTQCIWYAGLLYCI